MKLSMWNIADWLKKYNPKAEIEWGQPVIENIRLLSSSESSTLFSAHILYVGYEGNFFPQTEEILSV